MTIDTGNKTRVPTVRQIKCFIKIEREGKMKKLFRNSLIASVVAVAGATTFAGEANAQSVDVDFSGTIGNTCEITKLKDGKLAARDNDDIYIDARPVVATRAELGEVSVNCNGSGAVTLGSLTPTSADATTLSQVPGYGYLLSVSTDPNNIYSSALDQLNNGSLGTIPNGNTNVLNLNGSAQTLYLNVVATGGTTIPGGNYAFRTTVTITPQ